MRSDSDFSTGPSRPKGHPSEFAPPCSPGRLSSPTSFFLRSETDMHLASMHSQHNNSTQMPSSQDASVCTRQLEDSMYGVQSLEDTLAEAFASRSREAYPTPGDTVNESLLATEATARLGSEYNRISPRKMKSRQYLCRPKPAPAVVRRSSFSSHTASRDSSASASASISPRRSLASSQDPSLGNLTPSGLPLTIPNSPPSGSLRSLALSDEDCSVFDDCGSQVIQSSSEDEGIGDEDRPRSNTAAHSATLDGRSVPQLVMPSLSMPKRRPFSHRGSQMGRLKLLIIGPSETGKTCLLRSMLQLCEDIVHVDPGNVHWQSEASTARTEQITELNASTKPLPSWWSDDDAGKRSKRRRSIGASILDRNFCFVDTPGWTSNGSSDDEHMQIVGDHVTTYIEQSFGRNMSLSQLEDAELLSNLCGGGGFQVDLIIYVFRPTNTNIIPAEVDLLRHLSQLANVVPVIGKSDTTAIDHIQDMRAALRATLRSSGINTFSLNSPGEKLSNTVYAVSSALKDDSDIMDASLLMSPDYLPPRVASDLPELVSRIFEPETIQRLRHCAARKFLRWRKEHGAYSLDAHKIELQALSLRRPSSSLYDFGSTDSVQAIDASIRSTSPSGILVSPATSTFHHQKSRNVPETFGPGNGQGVTNNIDSCSQIYIAGWASDLQRALCAERHRLCNHTASRQLALRKIHSKNTSSKQRGKPLKDYDEMSLNPEQATDISHDRIVTNVEDPLGVLALGDELGRRGWWVLQVVGGCSVLATAAVWIVRNWCTVTGFLGCQSHAQVTRHAPVYADEWREIYLGGKW